MRPVNEVFDSTPRDGGSGKSTVLKEMRITSSIGFSSCERYQARKAIYKELLDAFKEVLNFMRTHSFKFKSRERK